MAINKFVKLCVATCLLYTIFAVSLQGAEGSCGGFIESCRAPFQHIDGYFRANCRNVLGEWGKTQIELNLFLANMDGTLVLGSGYKDTCEDLSYVRINQTLLIVAKCKRAYANYVPTSYDINYRVSNENGQLVWNSCYTRPSLVESPEAETTSSEEETATTNFSSTATQRTFPV